MMPAMKELIVYCLLIDTRIEHAKYHFIVFIALQDEMVSLVR